MFLWEGDICDHFSSPSPRSTQLIPFQGEKVEKSNTGARLVIIESSVSQTANGKYKTKARVLGRGKRCGSPNLQPKQQNSDRSGCASNKQIWLINPCNLESSHFQMRGLVIASHQAAAVQKMIRRTIITRQDWREKIPRAKRCSSQSWTTLVGNVTWRGQSGGMAGTFRGTGLGKYKHHTPPQISFFGSKELWLIEVWLGLLEARARGNQSESQSFFQVKRIVWFY